MAQFSIARILLLSAAIFALISCGDEEAAKPQVKSAASQSAAANFNVGGSVSGLSGKGLVLQANGANDLPVSANGKFKFKKTFSKGSTYTVTVKSAPEKQTCTVNRGTGKFTGTKVKNIAITCKTNDFAVGGKVSGLSGKGLGLQLNGTYDIAINKNGDFVFPGVRLADNSDYKVAIKTMPVKQLCTIKPVNSAQSKGTLNIIEVICLK
ncbi:MAG: hypothetical protein R8M11_03200 [Gallionella sp.]